MSQVSAANAEQIARKKMLAEQEHEEEMRIAQYIRQKDAREQVLRHYKPAAKQQLVTLWSAATYAS